LAAYGRASEKGIDPDDPSASINLAFDVADYFALKDKEARAIAAEVAAVVSNWKHVAEEAGLTRTEIDRMASVFERDDWKKARAAA
jgi:serine/threonine-protein kinase HipA